MGPGPKISMMRPWQRKVEMRGDQRDEIHLFSYVPLEDRVPEKHSLRAIRGFVEPILVELSPRFDAIYASRGRPSIPPEQLLRALLLQILYTIRSERMLCEQLQYNLLFRWFVGLGMGGEVWAPSTFSQNRDRLLDGEIAEAFFIAVRNEARRRGWVSDEHFTVDGTLLEAWASHKSFVPKNDEPGDDPPVGRNAEKDFRGEKRSNETHASRTDPDARLAKKGAGQGARLAYNANVLMENRNGLIVDAELLHATGTAERDAALLMLDRLPPTAKRRTLGADKGYDVHDFIEAVRERGVTPHVAQNTRNRRSAIDGRTTRHEGYEISQVKRKLVEQGFGWAKCFGLLRKLRHRGLRLARWMFLFTTGCYNLIRMRTLGEVCP